MLTKVRLDDGIWLLASVAAHHRPFTDFGWRNEESTMMMSVKSNDLLIQNGRSDLRNPPVEFGDLRRIARGGPSR